MLRVASSRSLTCHPRVQEELLSLCLAVALDIDCRRSFRTLQLETVPIATPKGPALTSGAAPRFGPSGGGGGRGGRQVLHRVQAHAGGTGVLARESEWQARPSRRPPIHRLRRCARVSVFLKSTKDSRVGTTSSSPEARLPTTSPGKSSPQRRWRRQPQCSMCLLSYDPEVLYFLCLEFAIAPLTAAARDRTRSSRGPCRRTN